VIGAVPSARPSLRAQVRVATARVDPAAKPSLQVERRIATTSTSSAKPSLQVERRIATTSTSSEPVYINIDKLTAEILATHEGQHTTKRKNDKLKKEVDRLSGELSWEGYKSGAQERRITTLQNQLALVKGRYWH
jgi:hypothetical protein